MPRESVLGQLDPAQLTPFARLIYEYLVSFRPSRDVTWLGRQSGIAPNTIAAWLKYGITPKRQKVVQLAERVPDLATLDELLLAAGLPSTATVQRERAAHSDVLRASLEELLRLVDADPTFDADARALIHRAMEGKVAEFIGQTDTWREYSHASPAQHEAQRAMDDALVYEPEPITTPDQAHGNEPSPPRRRSRTDHPSGGFRRMTNS